MITVATQDRSSQCVEFLHALFEEDDIIEFRPLPAGAGSRWGTIAELPGLIPWLEKQEASQRNVYFSANPRRNVGGTKAEDVLLARSLVADFDNGATPEDALARIRIASLPMPTAIIASGGGVQTWWRTKEPVADLRVWTARQKALAKALLSDSTVHDAPRIMRLPGFINWKYEHRPSAHIVDIDPCRTYSFESLTPEMDMSSLSQAFLLEGQLLPDGGRRKTMFTVACDLAGRGWDVQNATDLIMQRMVQCGLPENELDDCPRQIANAFKDTRTPLHDGVIYSRAEEVKLDADRKRKQAERQEAKARIMAETVDGVLASGGAAEPLDLRKRHTLDEVSCARRLAVEAFATVRYCVEWRKWLTWDGRRWRVDDGGAAIEAAKRLRDALWQEIASLSGTTQDAALQWVRSMGAAKRLESVVKLTSSEPAIRIRYRELDRHPFLLNLRNGVLNLATLQLQPHDPRLLITQIADVDFIEQAASPLWDKFIGDATAGDEELARFLQRAAGATLTGSVRDELLYCHYGRGANGKSTYLDALRHLLGDYAAVAPPSFLAQRNNDAHPTELAMMHGKRLVAAIEMEAGSRMRESLVKSLTGGDAIQARRMREDFWTLEPTWKIHVSFNDAPRVSGADDGIRRRLCVIPWRVTFDGTRRDSTLKERLTADGTERSGILNWCIAGLREWHVHGIAPPDSVRATTDDFTRQQDSFGQFLDERCEIGPQMKVEFGAFFGEFINWLQRRKESTELWTSNRVASELVKRNFEKEPRCNGGIHRGKYFYRGVGLLADMEH